MRICQIIPSLEEQYGGPSKSVLALSRAIAAEGHEVDLLATHPSAPSSATEGTLNIRVFKRGWPGRICPSGALEKHLRASSTEVVHHHSLWLRTLHYAHGAARARGVPLVISPRGMLGSWAIGHHRWRKRLARNLVHPGAFQAAAGWHVTSEEEAAEVRALGFRQPICVAPNAVTAPTPGTTDAAIAHWRERCPEVKHRRTAVFYSRFHSKKRVLELIDLWLREAPADWLLLLVGIAQDYTPRELETYVMRASGVGRVRAFDGIGQPPPYGVASLFLLPSHNENFGLVIAEAMAHGVPVLVTDTTPWTAVNGLKAGWCLSWEDYPAGLRLALSESPAQLAQRGALAREWVLREYSWAQSARRLLAFYQELAAPPQRPSAAPFA
ncbi:MAG: glycosyltransferase [Verrucomicrobia bacterium]|nr:glycosyltransferase [Verrucomicrobiota bacterium]